MLNVEDDRWRKKNFIWKGTGTYQYHLSGTGTVLMLSFFKTVIQYTGHTIRGGRGSRAGIVPHQWAPQRGKKLFSKYNGTVQENLIPEQKNYLKPLLRSRAFYVCRRSRTFPNFALFQATAPIQLLSKGLYRDQKRSDSATLPTAYRYSVTRLMLQNISVNQLHN